MRKKIIESFKQPFYKKNLMDFFIGSIFMFFPIVNFISLGYIAEKLKSGLTLEKKNIKWDENFKNLFKSGLNLFILIIGYLLIPSLFFFLGVFLISIIPSGGEILSLFLFRGLILIVFSTLIFLIAIYFLLFGICIYLEENSLKRGFDLKEIIEKIFLIPKEYTIIYVLVVGILMTSIVILTLLLNWVTGLLFSGFLLFYDLLVISNLLIKFYPRKSVEVRLPF